MTLDLHQVKTIQDAQRAILRIKEWAGTLVTSIDTTTDTLTESIDTVSVVATGAQDGLDAHVADADPHTQYAETADLGTAAASDVGDFAAAADGVTGGNSHDHTGGAGAQIDYGDLSGTPTIYNQTVEDEGTPVTQRSTINFTGAGVSVADTGSKTTVTIVGGAGEAFPIGSVFISVVSTNPNTLLGYGTWSAIAAGRVLVGLDSGDTDFDAAEETGGAKTVAAAGSNAAEASHTHTYSDVPNHVHVLNAFPTATGGSTGFTRDTSMSGTPAATGLSTANPTGGSGATGTTGAGSSHNHAFTGSATSVVQPYFVVYMWKRTA